MNKTDEKLKSTEVWVEEDIFCAFFHFSDANFSKFFVFR